MNSHSVLDPHLFYSDPVKAKRSQYGSESSEDLNADLDPF
jgi:hypothetical protein